MSKFEFVQEYKPISETTIYYTNKDGHYVTNSLSHDKDKAYGLFIQASSGVNLAETKFTLETIYSTKE